MRYEREMFVASYSFGFALKGVELKWAELEIKAIA